MKKGYMTCQLVLHKISSCFPNFKKVQTKFKTLEKLLMKNDPLSLVSEKLNTKGDHNLQPMTSNSSRTVKGSWPVHLFRFHAVIFPVILLLDI